jgi:ERCC4-type nuclease
MRDGRLYGHQIPGMLDLYDFSYLLVEGEVRQSPNGAGALEEFYHGRWCSVSFGSRGCTWAEFDHFLCVVEVRTPIRIRRTKSPEESARDLVSLWHYWSDKLWEEHRSHKTFNSEPHRVLMMKPCLVARVAKELDGIGWDKASAVASHFPDVLSMVSAPPSEWEKISGQGTTKNGRQRPGIGKLTAERIYRELRGKEKR